MFTCWICKCEFGWRAIFSVVEENSNCTLAEKNMLLSPRWRVQQCTYMMMRTSSIINGDNHHQLPKSILIFARVEQCYIFNVLVILIKITSLPLSSLLMWGRELWEHFLCLISLIQHITSWKPSYRFSPYRKHLFENLENGISKERIHLICVWESVLLI